MIYTTQELLSIVDGHSIHLTGQNLFLFPTDIYFLMNNTQVFQEQNQR